ncbi:unnamed protein product [Sphagnum tenellum]
MNKSEKAQLKQYIIEFKFVPGGRYLYYAGRPHHFWNNCFMFNTLEDSREDWAQVSYKVVNALMTGGGLGVEYSTYRPEGSLIKRTGGFSSGPIPKMEMTNEEGRRVMQGGSRRSALWAGLNWQHVDARKLIYAKDWHNIKIPGTNKTVWDVKTDPEGYSFPAPLDMTNISLCYDDEWLEQIAFGELPRIYIENVRQALKTGEPGFAFNFGKNSKEILRNACTELTSEDDSDVCNIGSLNFAAITTKQELNQVIELATKFLICGTLGADLPFEAVYKIREKNRRLGLGIMGFHEWLLMRGYRYEVVPEMHLWLNDYMHTSNKVSAQFADHLGISRPIKNRAIAPTGTIGILAGTTTGIEPMFAAAYKRRYLKGTDWHYQYVVDPIADRLAKMGANADEIEGAIDLARDPERRIKAQYDIQKSKLVATVSARERRNAKPKAERQPRQPKAKQEKAAPKQVSPILLKPKNKEQALVKKVLAGSDLAFIVGEAGTGKTALAIDRIVDLLFEGVIEKIILCRPNVEANSPGENKLGTLPGGIREKLGPILAPMFDELENKLGGGPLAKQTVDKWIMSGVVEIIPLSMIKGRTCKMAGVLFDEMQDATYKQWKMALTRQGEGSYVYVTGDPKQSELDPKLSGMTTALLKLEEAGFPVVRMKISVRHINVSKIASLAQHKAKQQNHADVGSPRDLLIEILQEIDKGMPVHALMIVFADLSNMAAPSIGFATASPSPLITLGMLEEAKASVLDID